MALQKLFYKESNRSISGQKKRWEDNIKGWTGMNLVTTIGVALETKLGRKEVLVSHLRCPKNIERLCGRIEYSAICCPRSLSRRHITLIQR